MEGQVPIQSGVEPPYSKRLRAAALRPPAGGNAATDALQPLDDRTQLDDFDGALLPVMFPADDQIATRGVMAVFAKLAAGEFELDPHPLPAMVVYAAFRLAVRISRLDPFDNQAELRADHAEQVDDALFIDRFMLQTAEIEQGAEHGAER